MHGPETPQRPDNEETAREDATISLFTSLGGMAAGVFFAVNGVSVARYGWDIEAPSVVVNGLFATGSTGFASHQWVKFHRWRDSVT